MDTAQQKTDFKSFIKNEFDSLSSKINVNDHFFELRKIAFNNFYANGLPTIKSENWKYTNLMFLNKIDFSTISGSENLDDYNELNYQYKDFDSYKIFLVNGKLNFELSQDLNESGCLISELSGDETVCGIKICSFDTKNLNQEFPYHQYFGKIAANTGHTFQEINSALNENLIVIEIEKNTVIEIPIHIINIIDAKNSNVFSNPRILIVSHTFSSVKIVESTYVNGSNIAVKNIVKEIFLDENAHLNYYKIQDNNELTHTFDYTHVYQKSDSHFDEAAISINGKFIRNDLRAELDGENIESHFYGIFIAGSSDFVDNHTLVDHKKPHCFSNENYRGILFDKGTGVFNGKIMVRPDAQKTNAYQSNKNVLLSDNASIYTKPELEIYADDVKCSHGATSGALDETSKFYLRARGIGEKEAEIMLLNAFAAEVISNIKIESLKETILHSIEEKLIKI